MAGQSEALSIASGIHQELTQIKHEVEQFDAFLQANSEHLSDRATFCCDLFQRQVRSELANLDALKEKDPTLEDSIIQLQGSNVLHYSSLWAVAKTCSSVTHLGKRQTAQKSGSRKNAPPPVPPVDIISENGMEFVKVITHSEDRVRWELIRAGFDGGSDDSDSSVDDDQGTSGRMTNIVTYKKLKQLIEASRASRIQLPEIRAVFTRLREDGASNVLSELFHELRELGITVQTMDDLQIPDLSTAFPIMAPFGRYSMDKFTDTLVMDCTMLISLSSDISWGGVQPQDWHTKAVIRQTQDEKENPLLFKRIFPGFRQRKLTCTRGTYDKAIECVNIIGTEAEKRRASLLFLPVNGKESNLTRQERLDGLQELSAYPIKPEMMLPIEVIDVTIPVMLTHLPSVASTIVEELEGMAKTTLQSLIYAWVTGYTLISSNREALNKLNHFIMMHRSSDTSIRGPDVWVFNPARNLVGDYYVSNRDRVPEAWKRNVREKERSGKKALRAKVRESRESWDSRDTEMAGT